MPATAARAPASVVMSRTCWAVAAARHRPSSVAGPVRMGVFDVQGRLGRRLVDDRVGQTGVFSQNWDLRNNRGERVSSGVYFVRLRAMDAVRVKRIAVIR